MSNKTVTNQSNHEGEVKFFNQEKGFGFIMPDNGGKDIFFHISNLSYSNVKTGDRVSYQVGYNNKGAIAEKVAKIA